MRPLPLLSALLTLAVPGILAAAEPATIAAYRAALLSGVREITAPGLPGSLAVYGKDAFPVVVGKGDGGRAAVIAAARLGKGRVVAFAHDGYFGRAALEAADNGTLMKNVVRWAGGKAEAHVGVVGSPDLAAFLRAAGTDAREVRLSDDLNALDALAVTHGGVPDGSAPRIQAWIQRGGGLVAASTGWGWAQITGKPITRHPLSELTTAAGLAWTSGTVEKTSAKGFDTAAAIPALVHAGAALDALIARTPLPAAESAQGVSSVMLAARSVPPSDAILGPRLKQLRAAAGAAAVPGEKTPVTLAMPLPRLALALETDEAQRVPAAEVTAQPAAADFPGAVPAGAQRVSRKVVVETAVPGWHSTGLYAAPGEKIIVTVPAGAARKRLAVRIGAHTDELWHLDQWRRAPAISRQFPITTDATQAANGYGGLVYIVVPGNAAAERLEVTIAGAVEAPYYRLGETDSAEWRTSIRSRPGPWAELECSHVVFTVPSSLVRALDDPQPLMKLWDEIVKTQDDFGSVKDRRQPERIVSDRQISAGYMHSGYPIMTPIDGSTVLALDEKRLKSEGSWGHFHELGHNHQSGDWTFDGTGEVTNNVFAMYVYAKALNLTFDSGHPAIRDRKVRAERVRKYMTNGAPFATWKGDPFLALSMYIELIDAFGFDPFLKLFADYRALPGSARPKSDDEKRDQWMVRFSRAVGKNLGPFFQSWGVPTSEAARASIKELPEWMPNRS